VSDSPGRPSVSRKIVLARWQALNGPGASSMAAATLSARVGRPPAEYSMRLIDVSQ
jgi:hypothetical protein